MYLCFSEIVKLYFSRAYEALSFKKVYVHGVCFFMSMKLKVCNQSLKDLLFGNDFFLPDAGLYSVFGFIWYPAF